MHNRYGPASWKYIAENLSTDITLVQEANPSDMQLNKEHFLWEKVTNKSSGSGVLSKELKLNQLEFPKSHIGSVIGASVVLADGKIIDFFSIYAILDRYFANENTKNGVSYSSTTLHRILSDLTFPLVRANSKKHYVVLGGDFNMHVSFDETYNSKDFCSREHRLVFERIEDFGMVECVKKFYPNNVRTYRHTTKTRIPLQIDYLYVSKNLEEKIKSCTVLENEEVVSLSDHNPILITLDI